jgi:dihydroorotase
VNTILLKNVKIADSKHVSETTHDILIVDGIIKEIGSIDSTTSDSIHDFEGAFVSPGWMDMHIHLREPGFEHKETVLTGTNAAAFGGFTAVACMPNTKPAIHTRDVVEFIISKAKPTLVDVYPIACVTKDRKGESLAEMADLKAGGAVAFSDDGDPVFDSRIMRLALEYSSMYSMPIINHEEDLHLSRPGHMNEGLVSTRLGLDGTPGIAEEVMIARDILLAELTGGHVHVAHISTAKGVELVRRAKKDGIKVTTEVCPHHFDLTDIEIERNHFDTNYKMHPPLRTEDDRLAMIEGLRDGTIDAICTDHAPHSIEEKDVEFIYAPNGILGLETAWGISCKRLIHEHKFDLSFVLEKMIDNPRTILNIPVPEVKVGQFANLTIFTTDDSWTFEKKHIKSKSKNTPYVGTEMKGKALAVVNKGRIHKNEF